jgi:hypothetical protein
MIKYKKICILFVKSCPKSYICNPSQGKCDKNSTEGETQSIKWSEKIRGKKLGNVNINCPDGESQCNDD